MILGAASLLALAAGAGCGGDSSSLASEMDDSSYRDGQQMERQGRWDEALVDYLKVIDRRGDSAPESNLDAGLIFLNHRKDPIFAIYHFRKYLELEPNSKQAVYVRGLIDAATREFARALPGQPLESETEHLGVEEQVERLKRENDSLRAENAALRDGATVPVMHSSAIDAPSIVTQPSAPPDDAAQPAPVAVSPISMAPGDQATSSAITDAPQDEPHRPPRSRRGPLRPPPCATTRWRGATRSSVLPSNTMATARSGAISTRLTTTFSRARNHRSRSGWT
jgi:hypothetical protein